MSIQVWLNHPSEVEICEGWADEFVVSCNHPLETESADDGHFVEEVDRRRAILAKVITSSDKPFVAVERPYPSLCRRSLWEEEFKPYEALWWKRFWGRGERRRIRNEERHERTLADRWKTGVDWERADDALVYFGDGCVDVLGVLAAMVTGAFDPQAVRSEDLHESGGFDWTYPTDPYREHDGTRHLYGLQSWLSGAEDRVAPTFCPERAAKTPAGQRLQVVLSLHGGSNFAWNISQAVATIKSGRNVVVCARPSHSKEVFGLLGEALQPAEREEVPA